MKTYADLERDNKFMQLLNSIPENKRIDFILYNQYDMNNRIIRLEGKNRKAVGIGSAAGAFCGSFITMLIWLWEKIK